jgi:hypothetical protein
MQEQAIGLQPAHRVEEVTGTLVMDPWLDNPPLPGSACDCLGR